MAVGKAVVTFPIPGVAGATGAATLDAKYMTEKVVVTNGSATTEFTYSDYKDWNNPRNKIEVLPGRWSSVETAPSSAI